MSEVVLCCNAHYNEGMTHNHTTEVTICYECAVTIVNGDSTWMDHQGLSEKEQDEIHGRLEDLNLGANLGASDSSDGYYTCPGCYADALGGTAFEVDG